MTIYDIPPSSFFRLCLSLKHEIAMSATTVLEEVPVRTTASPRASTSVATRPRPVVRRIMQFVRRTHLYVGLFLFPWAILYGVSGFLFNHPTLFADAPTSSFQRADVAGTAMEDIPSPHDQAAAVLAALNEQKRPDSPFLLGTGEARYATRDSFIATVKADRRTFFVVFDPKTASGTIRETTPGRTAEEPAPFATGKADAPRQRGMGMMGPMKHDHSGVKVTDSVPDRLKAAIPTLLQRKGFPAGEVTITTSPDIKFPVEAAGKTWTATFNPLTTSVTGTAGQDQSDLTVRGFLLRMHLTRGYPGEYNTKWFWAVGVDAIALTLCFWGLSGLFMWWQIKATRTPGLIVLLVSAAAATTLGVSMYGLLTA